MTQTPSQTACPFFGLALPYGAGPRVAPEWHPDAIRIGGQVLDGAGETRNRRPGGAVAAGWARHDLARDQRAAPR